MKKIFIRISKKYSLILFIFICAFYYFTSVNNPYTSETRNSTISSVKLQIEKLFEKEKGKISKIIKRSKGNESIYYYQPRKTYTIIEESQIPQDWQEINGSKSTVFVYSAYYDTRQTHTTVRINAIYKKKAKVEECIIETSSGNVIKTKAKKESIHEGWGLAYSSVFIVCDFQPKRDELPVNVALQMGGKISQKFSIHQLHTRNNEGFMSVCIKPLHYEFNRAVWLVEFIEMYLLLGANHFIFYNHTTGPDVDKVLGYYESLGIATIYSWSLPVVSQKEIRTEGIFSALNDCNLKSANRFTYSAFVDIDEFIIPKRHINYKDLFDSLGDYQEFIFQNFFFYLYWNNSTDADEILYGTEKSLGTKLYGDKPEDRPYLLTLYKTTRLSEPHKHGIRSKYIAKPDKALECGNHKVWRQIKNYKGSYKVQTTYGSLHHYRICEFGGFACLEGKHQEDKIVHKWMHPLFTNVATACRQIYKDDGKCPPAPPLGSPW